jgi:serine/threonine protein phosphatase PrpC
MTERDLDRAVERLITAANEEGGVDNISVVLARVEAT